MLVLFIKLFRAPWTSCDLPCKDFTKERGRDCKDNSVKF